MLYKFVNGSFGFLNKIRPRGKVFPPEYLFTNSGSVGKTGPTQGEVDTEYDDTSLEGRVGILGDGIQTWEVPMDGTYLIEAGGASGADNGTVSGGAGSSIEGEHPLNAGDKLRILVGQQGTESNGAAGGGGGGSFVAKEINSVSDVEQSDALEPGLTGLSFEISGLFSSRTGSTPSRDVWSDSNGLSFKGLEGLDGVLTIDGTDYIVDAFQNDIIVDSGGPELPNTTESYTLKVSGTGDSMGFITFEASDALDISRYDLRGETLSVDSGQYTTTITNCVGNTIYGSGVDLGAMMFDGQEVELLAAAGGGGGAAIDAGSTPDGVDASSNAMGTPDAEGWYEQGDELGAVNYGVGLEGRGGHTGGIAEGQSGGGGGGFLTDGSPSGAQDSNYGEPGEAFINGGVGGQGGNSVEMGGFGGGGSTASNLSDSTSSAGAGGGYTGGTGGNLDGSRPIGGGGGGLYHIDSSAQKDSTTGHGYVYIEKL